MKNFSAVIRNNGKLSAAVGELGISLRPLRIDGKSGNGQEVSEVIYISEDSLDQRGSLSLNQTDTAGLTH